MISAADIIDDLENRDARLVAVIAELPDGRLQVIQYKPGKTGPAVPTFISDAVGSMSISARQKGNVHIPVCEIKNAKHSG